MANSDNLSWQHTVSTLHLPWVCLSGSRAWLHVMLLMAWAVAAPCRLLGRYWACSMTQQLDSAS
jgi:hypothetical protein